MPLSMLFRLNPPAYSFVNQISPMYQFTFKIMFQRLSYNFHNANLFFELPKIDF